MKFSNSIKYFYTIGYGDRDINDFLYLLKKYNIDCLIDVRSHPYSKINSNFNKNNIKHFLENHNIKYIFMGELLGGRPNDESCYDENGKINYNIVKHKEFFIEGIKILEKLYNEYENIIIMCSEIKYNTCHRSKLISNALFELGYDIKHIDEYGELKKHYIKY